MSTDAVFYPSNDPNPETACPQPLKIGTGLGNVHVIGTAPMDKVRPLLERGTKVDHDALRRLFGARPPSAPAAPPASGPKAPSSPPTPTTPAPSSPAPTGAAAAASATGRCPRPPWPR